MNSLNELDVIAFSDAFNQDTQTKRDGASDMPGNNISGSIMSEQDLMMRQTVNTKLMRLRAMNPFIPIEIFPTFIITLSLAANEEKTLPIPSGAKYVTFSSSAFYFVSATGIAQNASADILNGSGSLIKPDGKYYYIEGMQSLSIRSSAAALTGVSASFYFQL